MPPLGVQYDVLGSHFDTLTAEQRDAPSPGVVIVSRTDHTNVHAVELARKGVLMS
jgi:hypothetical protein